MLTALICSEYDFHCTTSYSTLLIRCLTLLCRSPSHLFICDELRKPRDRRRLCNVNHAGRGVELSNPSVDAACFC